METYALLAGTVTLLPASVFCRIDGVSDCTLMLTNSVKNTGMVTHHDRIDLPSVCENAVL